MMQAPLNGTGARERRIGARLSGRWSLAPVVWASLSVALGVTSSGCGEGENDSPQGAGATEPRQGQVDVECAARAAPAELRRLTRFEYGALVRDVLGVSDSVAQRLPRDEVAGGFDNQAGSLSVTDAHVEAYLRLAEELAAELSGSEPSLSRLSGCEAGADGGRDEGCARALIEKVGSGLFRRPLRVSGDGAEERAARLLALFESDFSASGFREGARRALAALLQAPEFTYRLELAGGGARSGLALAAPAVLAERLSFLFGASTPDAELERAVREGALSSVREVEREARRLWQTPTARRAAWHFHAQWLGLSDLEVAEKNVAAFPRWDAELRAELEAEARRFVETALWEGGGLEALLSGRERWSSARLDDFYLGEPSALAPGEWSNGRWPEAEPRAGVLTTGAFLAAHAKVDQTSPVTRGKFVREQLLCQPLPPPPPDVAVFVPPPDPRATTRERFLRHRSDASCAGCHRLMDPIGFAFESFDAVGRHRSEEAGRPIDASGELSGTDVDGPFDGPQELAERLARSSDVRGCVVEKWFQYALGRAPTEADACTLESLKRSFDAADGDVGELLVALATSEPFISPRAADEESAP